MQYSSFFLTYANWKMNVKIVGDGIAEAEKVIIFAVE